MRHVARIQPRDVIAERFMRIGQHHRGAGENRAQENLQAAIAANVVECRPDRRGSARRAFGDDGARQCFQRMAGDFWYARRAGRQHQPLGGAFGPGRRGGLKRQLRGDNERDCLCGPLRRLVGDDSIDLGVRDQRIKMRRIKIGRAQQHAPCDTIELDHGEPRFELVRQLEQDRAARQLTQTAAQNRMPEDVRQRYHMVGIGDRAALELRAQIVAEREGLTRGHFRRPARNRPRWRGTLRPRKW
ncbi:hypothetical protein ABIF65_007485 [Bradyrhizobium japonicum]